jgi:hypothetical protein
MKKLLQIEFEWNHAIKAAICMLPMVIAYVTGHNSLLVPFGQGGFFYSTLPLPEKRLEKLMYFFLMMGVGLGFYLLGGTAAASPLLSILITFMVAVTIAIMSGGKIIAPLAFSLISVYTAGLNVSDPSKLQVNFEGFAFIFALCGFISLIPIWKPSDLSNFKIFKPAENLFAGVKLGIGMSLALFIGNLFSFAKMGWPVSAVGTIVRFNETESKKRARSRIIGTVGGGLMAMVFFIVFNLPGVFIVLAYVFGILHSLMSKTLLGKTVFFYTVTILILYSMGDLSQGTLIAAQRIFYNMIGVMIAVFVISYSFPRLMSRIEKTVADYDSSVN